MLIVIYYFCIVSAEWTSTWSSQIFTCTGCIWENAKQESVLRRWRLTSTSLFYNQRSCSQFSSLFKLVLCHLFHIQVFDEKWKFCHHLLAFMSFQTCMSFFLEECWLSNSWWSPLTSIVFLSLLLKPMGTNTCLVLQNIFFMIIRKKEIYTGVERHEGELMMTEFSFLGELFL